MTARARILVVDDHPSNVKALRARLEAEGYQVLEALNGLDALLQAQQGAPDLVLLDVMMPGMDGYEVCRRLKAQTGAGFLPVILVTARTETDAVVAGLQAGADEYVPKPFEPAELLARVRSMLRIRRLWDENRQLRQEVAGRHCLEQLVGQSPAMQRLGALLSKVIDSSVTVLLLGETGTGKEAIARCVHYQGPRRDGRFVAVNCGALSEGLLDSELFGHRRGAFTGATEDRAGLFEAADEGTLFLDEIGDTSPGLQVKLLRVLQEGEFTRVGETQARHTRARVVAATNRDLEADVCAGRFRQDLYYRLSVFPITVPPLRARRQDIPLLAAHFAERHAARAGRPVPLLTPEALTALGRYDWPGNVRELENEIERALVLTPAGAAIELTVLSEKVLPQAPPAPRQGKLREILAAVKQEVIENTLTACNGNRSRAAQELGLTRWTLLQKLKAYGVSASDGRGAGARPE
ncbi:MAG: sigma-54 dependent transcriptional regulator [Candidatus Latescibacterota bacterium]